MLKCIFTHHIFELKYTLNQECRAFLKCLRSNSWVSSLKNIFAQVFQPLKNACSQTIYICFRAQNIHISMRSKVYPQKCFCAHGCAQKSFRRNVSSQLLFCAQILCAQKSKRTIVSICLAASFQSCQNKLSCPPCNASIKKWPKKCCPRSLNKFGNNTTTK